MRVGAVIVAAWFAVAAPCFSQSNLFEVDFGEQYRSQVQASLPFEIEVYNSSGEARYYRLEFSMVEPDLLYYRGIGLVESGHYSSRINSGSYYTFTASPSIRYASFGASDPGLETGPFTEYREIRASIYANWGNTTTTNYRRLIWRRNFVVKVVGDRVNANGTGGPAIVGGSFSDTVTDNGTYLVYQPVRSNGHWPIEFRSSWGKHGSVAGLNGGYAVRALPWGQWTTLAGPSLQGGDVSWMPSDFWPTVWQFNTGSELDGNPWDPPGDDPGTDPQDFSPAVEAMEATAFVAFGGFAGLLIIFALRRLYV